MSVSTARPDLIATANDNAGPGSTDPGPLKVVPLRHWGRWVAAALLIVCLGSMAWSLWNRPAVNRHVIGQYLFETLTLRGVLVTLELTAIAMAIGIVGGVLLAVMRLSRNPVLAGFAGLFVWFFRGTPQLVQIIFWGFLGALYPHIAIGIPFTHEFLFSLDTNRVVGAFAAAILGLGLNEAAYAAEIVRGGILAVDHGQTEAARALGMSGGRTMRHIVLPQAMRVITPAMGNEVITMIKATSLVSVISGKDLLTNLQSVYNQNFQVIPLLIVASLWYLALVSILGVGQHFLERRFARGVVTPR